MEKQSVMNDYEKPRYMFWLAEKLMVIHSVVSLCFVAGLGLASLWVSAGVVIALWLLTFGIFQEWRNSN